MCTGTRGAERSRMNTVHIVNRTNRTNTRLYEQTLSERSLTICERSCPTPHSGSRSGLGSRLPTAPPRTRPRLARRCALHARASRATVCRFEQVAGLQTDAKERVLRPLRDVLRRVALRLAGDQADERLLHDPTLRDAVSVDAEEAHAAIRPQVPADGRLDAGLDETDDEVTSKCLALGSKEAATSATVERLFSRVGIAFSAKRKSSDPATVADLMFANANLP